MFSRMAWVVTVSLLSFPVAAQQPVVWPWQAMQIWAVPADGAAMPFPTPFWLWVPRPPPVQAQAAMAPTHPLAVAPTPGVDQPPPSPAVTEKQEALTPRVAEPVIESPSPTPVPAVIAGETVDAKPTSIPAPIRKAPVAKQKPKATARTTVKTRKLCFKDGKLDVCP